MPPMTTVGGLFRKKLFAGISVFERDSRTAVPVRWEGYPRPQPEGASVPTRGGESASAGEALEGIGQAN